MEGLSRLTGATPSPILLDTQEERVKFADGLKPVLYIPLYMLQVSICLEEKMGLVAALGTLWKWKMPSFKFFWWDNENRALVCEKD